MKDKERGAVLLETAFILPFLVIALVMTAQLGMIINAQLVVNEAARTGAREYVAHGHSDRAWWIATMVVENNLNTDNGDFDLVNDFELEIDNNVTCTVEYGVPLFFNFEAPLFSNQSILGSHFELKGRATFYLP